MHVPSNYVLFLSSNQTDICACGPISSFRSECDEKLCRDYSIYAVSLFSFLLLLSLVTMGPYLFKVAKLKIMGGNEGEIGGKRNLTLVLTLSLFIIFFNLSRLLRYVILVAGADFQTPRSKSKKNSPCIYYYYYYSILYRYYFIIILYWKWDCRFVAMVSCGTLGWIFCSSETGGK